MPTEIRQSVVAALLEKVKKGNYSRYLRELYIEKMRSFRGTIISFDFPVTALIGPNGSGKTTILGAALSVYSPERAWLVFADSRVDRTTSWRATYKLIDKDQSPKKTICGHLGRTREGAWKRSHNLDRGVKYISIKRTLPLKDQHFRLKEKLLRVSHSRNRRRDHRLASVDTVESNSSAVSAIFAQASRILGRDLRAYRFLQVSVNHARGFGIYLGENAFERFSEFNFGAGESSVLRIVEAVEALSDGELVLIDEIDNGLHPLATRRLVEYLIEAASIRKIQCIFTAHSDHGNELVSGVALLIESGSVLSNPADVVEDVLKAPARVLRRHGRRLSRWRVGYAPIVPVLRRHPQGGPGLPRAGA
jgi:AAA domain, putative AbiEii toxin, Type IV TA system